MVHAAVFQGHSAISYIHAAIDAERTTACRCAGDGVAVEVKGQRILDVLRLSESNILTKGNSLAACLFSAEVIE